MKNIYNSLIEKEDSLAVIGLGYVGLPIALGFAKKLNVVGFDINADRVDLMNRGIDPSKELSKEAFGNKTIKFTHKLEDLKDVRFFIVAVPTPINDSNEPNIQPLQLASETVGKVLKKGDYVVYESTVYPGCTEEDCIPILEKMSGLTWKEDFNVGYSPERINPGDHVHTLEKIVKVASGDTAESLENIAKTYELVVDAGVHRASCIKVAEASKIIENTQRDLNIGLMNELSIIFDKMNINTFEVLEAAGTKWNFLKFYPGLVGGHCIGVDPYYLTHKAKQLDYHANIINSGRFVNDSMGRYVANKTVKNILFNEHSILSSKVLVIGATFKENVSDIRNSKVIDIINELEDYGCQVDILDKNIDKTEFKAEYGKTIIDEAKDKYQAIILAVNHDDYSNLSEDYFLSLASEKPTFVDVKGIYKDVITKFSYWSL